MSDIEKLLGIECLIFSSHKTATQTITYSLNQSGTPSLHAHILENIGMVEGQFNEFIKRYRASKSRRIKIISVFRDPLERLISSFFESLSEDAYAWVPQDEGEMRSADQDGIRSVMSRDELQKLFYRYCETKDGYGESIAYICNELGMDISDLRFSMEERIGKNQLENCDLYLLRFDELPWRLPDLLESIVGKKVPIVVINDTSSKSYAVQYSDLKKHLRMRGRDIEKMYASRKALIDLFYPGQYESILSERICRYGKPEREA